MSDRKVSLDQDITLTVQPAQKQSISTEVTVLRYAYRVKDEEIVAIIKEFPKPIVLWSGDDFAANDGFTLAQADTRLKSIIQP